MASEYDQYGSLTRTRGRFGTGLADIATKTARRRNKALAQAADDDEELEEYEPIEKMEPIDKKPWKKKKKMGLLNY